MFNWAESITFCVCLYVMGFSAAFGMTERIHIPFTVLAVSNKKEKMLQIQ